MEVANWRNSSSSYIWSASQTRGSQTSTKNRRGVESLSLSSFVCMMGSSTYSLGFLPAGNPLEDSDGEQSCHTEETVPPLSWAWRSSQWEFRGIQAFYLKSGAL